ncbi:MAG: glycoside hydrolase family 44 protein, partial [Treponema sp.]|nr:glycoside hydrolase family 44 protein [Treponema sp.]
MNTNNSSAPVNIAVTVDTASGNKAISPYIYGLNVVPAQSTVIKSARLGGNRTTGYNWENNLSNAGEDWQNFNDEYLFPKDKDGSTPAITMTDFAEKAKKAGAYTLITLPMAGFAANDRLRTVTKEETAPSKRFTKIVDRKNSSLSLTPDVKDDYVYSDELLNYLVTKLGVAHNGGINGYSLDNEPALWPETHPRIHPTKTTVAELLEKSISLASVVKDYDSGAEVFGPALYGVGAYTNFQNAPDWKGTYSSTYKWFIDAYLDKMREAELLNGRRLLDVLDLHYYTEARCPSNHRVCDDRNNNDQCFYTRFQSTRSLWDKSYVEKSWVTQVHRRFLPVLPIVNESIEKYYPGTKLSISEYNFGYENHVSGGIAQADALGIFASHGVYFAALWALSEKVEYAYAGLNLYTNYDGSGGSFGGTLVSSSTDNIEYSSVYASTDSKGALHIILLNKSVNEAERFSVNVNSSNNYTTYECYGFNSNSAAIKHIGAGTVSGGLLSVDLPAMSAYHLVLK